MQRNKSSLFTKAEKGEKDNSRAFSEAASEVRKSKLAGFSQITDLPRTGGRGNSKANLSMTTLRSLTDVIENKNEINVVASQHSENSATSKDLLNTNEKRVPSIEDDVVDHRAFDESNLEEDDIDEMSTIKPTA